MKENIVSIILPVYNCADFIDRCLDSIRNQTFDNIEVLIIDDGSNDSTAQKCNEYIEKNHLKNFYYFYQNNSGVSNARNNGISRATSNLIMFVDADDWLEKDCVEILYKEYKTTNSQLVVSNFTSVNIDGTKFVNEFKQPQKNLKKVFLLNILSTAVSKQYEDNIFNCSRTVWGKLYKKEIIDKNNIKFRENIKLLEDGIFNLEYANKIDNVSYVNKSLYYYFNNAKSASKKFYPNRLEEDLKKISIIEEIIDDSDINFINAKQVLYIDLFFSTIQKSIFSKKNTISFLEKRKKLKEIINNNLYKDIFNTDVYKYIDYRKRISLVCLKNKLYTLVSFLFAVIQ